MGPDPSVAVACAASVSERELRIEGAGVEIEDADVVGDAGPVGHHLLPDEDDAMTDEGGRRDQIGQQAVTGLQRHLPDLRTGRGIERREDAVGGDDQDLGLPLRGDRQRSGEFAGRAGRGDEERRQLGDCRRQRRGAAWDETFQWRAVAGSRAARRGCRERRVARAGASVRLVKIRRRGRRRWRSPESWLR